MSKDRILRDPFDQNSNPFHIIKRVPPLDNNDPKCGYVLGWISERYRNGSGQGWKGWVPLEYGDKFTGENGEKLKEYISDPPMRMIGPDKVDNLVRRADLVLCRIVADWFDARQENSARESRERVAALAVPEGEEVLPGVEGVTSIGGGRRPDKGVFGNKALDAKLRTAE